MAGGRCSKATTHMLVASGIGAALATFTWRGTVPGSYSLRQVNPQGWTATADPGADTATSAVDGDASTRYTTGTGQFTTVPLTGAPVRYVRITLTAASGSWFSVADVRAYTTGQGH